MHYGQRDWPKRECLEVGQHNVIRKSLVPRSKVLLPPLHIKLGLAKQFIKALKKDEPTFKFLRSMFPKVSDAKVQGGIFVGPEIKKMLSSTELEARMTPVEKAAWQAFRDVVQGFLGNKKVENYKEVVENMVIAFGKLGCNMSIKLHYMYSHLDFFSDNMGDISDEHGERFHQDIKTMERRYQGRWDPVMMGDYMWTLVRSNKQATYRKKQHSKAHF